MRGWRCGRCGQVVFLDSDECLRCGAGLGFQPSVVAVVATGDGDRRCATARDSGCTWLVEDAGTRCIACRQVTVVPPLADPVAAARYRRAASDHRHLVAQLLQLGLPVAAVELQLLSGAHDDSVMIGHQDGVVTIDVDEADDARRERARQALGEPYRTVLGHLRHECGHALFPHLVGEDDLADVRALFGDETSDYQAALDTHYAQGPPDGWQEEHVSAYATMHPAEDWAETFAHVLHVDDVLATADAFGLRVDEDGLADEMPSSNGGDARAASGGDHTGTMRERLDRFVPLAFALNAVTRAMGDGDLYPFVVTEAVERKLVLVAALVGIDGR